MPVKCPSCDATFEIDELGPVYECGDCGEVFGKEDSADGCSHRCPTCQKFASKSDQLACPECNEANDEDQYENVQVWASDGCEMEAVDVPECEYCHAKADEQFVHIYETPTSGTYCCDGSECCVEYIRQNGSEFELVDS